MQNRKPFNPNRINFMKKIRAGDQKRSTAVEQLVKGGQLD